MEQLINTTKYSTLEIAFFGAAGATWVVVYAAVIRGIIKNKFVEIPAATVVANFSWEIIWGFVYRTDLGAMFVWGYRTWFFMDLYIVWQLYRYGYKQVLNPYLQQYFKLLTTFGIVTFTVGLYFFVTQGYDTTQGLNSGYVTTIMSAATYLVLFIRQPNPGLFSEVVVWGTVVAIGTSGVFAWSALRGSPIALTLWTATFLLDWVYVYAFYRKRRLVQAAALQAGT